MLSLINIERRSGMRRAAGGSPTHKKSNWGNKEHKVTTISFFLKSPSDVPFPFKSENDYEMIVTLTRPVNGNKTSLVDSYRNKNQTTFSQLTSITFVKGTLLYLMYLVVTCAVWSPEDKKRSTYAECNALFLCFTPVSRNPLYGNTSITEGLAIQISSSRPKRWSLELTHSWGQKLEHGKAC